MAQLRGRKRKGLCTPFLVTVATIGGTVGPGCGGAVTTDVAGADGSAGSQDNSTTGSSGGVTGSGTSSGSSGLTSGTGGAAGSAVTTGGGGAGMAGTGGGTPIDCPGIEPANGATCATEGQDCFYPKCPWNPFLEEALCKGGHWMVSWGSCNPPGPDAGLCPPYEPRPTPSARIPIPVRTFKRVVDAPPAHERTYAPTPNGESSRATEAFARSTLAFRPSST